jgi:hypothetical protein
MVSNQDPGIGFHDPLLKQAETILAQRQTRCLVLDRDILGEPGWDILLCAFIAYRKGVACILEDVASTIDLSPALTKRWVTLLAERKMLTIHRGLFSITEETEQKISKMFEKQITEMLKAAYPGLQAQTSRSPR